MWMKLWIAILYSCLVTFAARGETQVVLGVGQSKILSVPRGQSIRVTQQGQIGITDRGNEIEILAKKPGPARIRAGDQDYQVLVLSVKAHECRESLRGKLQGKMGISLDFTPQGEIKLTGRLLRLSDLLDLSSTGCGFENHLDFDSDVKINFSAHCRDKQPWLPPIEKILDFDKRPLELRLNEEGKKAATDFFSTLGVRVVLDSSPVGTVPLVRTRLFFAEVTKDSHQTFGFDWSKSYEAQVLPERSEGSFFVKLNSLHSRGKAQVLASPVLVSQSGSEAEFLAGGEIPIAIKVHRGHEVTWKKYGVLLKINAVAGWDKRIQMNLVSEISAVDSTRPDENFPSFRTNRVSSQLNLMSLQVVALSGLFRLDSGQGSEGLLGLDRVPILGHLFKSQGFLESKSELVIFVLPEVITPEEGGHPKEVSTDDFPRIPK